MRKLFPLILLSLCLTGCGEVDISYKASNPIVGEVLDPYYGIDYKSTNTVGVDDFTNAVRTRGYIDKSGKAGADPEIFPEGEVYNVTPLSISEVSSDTQLFYNSDYGLLLYTSLHIVQFPTNHIVLKTAFIDYDNNGIKDIVFWSYTGKNRGSYYLDYFDRMRDRFFNVTELKYSSVGSFQFLIRDQVNNPAVYINDKKVYYVDNQFYCTGVFEYTKPAYYYI